jgi:hypothetical protein
MTVSTEFGARIEASHVLAGVKFLALHTSRYTMLAGAGLLSGYISAAKQLADETYMSKAPDTFMQLYNKCAAIEMAALVFGFSIAASILCGVLDFLFAHDPMSLDTLLEKRQVSLAEVWSVELTELRKQAFVKYRKDFDHLTIEKKASTLLGVLNPPTTTDVVPGFVVPTYHAWRNQRAARYLRPSCGAFPFCGDGCTSRI